MTQKDALTLLKTGRNAFITGPAGSGKTHLMNQYIKYLKEHHVSVAITASTGIAATHMGGMTIHSWSGMGIKSDMNELDLEALADKDQLVSRLQSARVLIIDEVSMLHYYQLDMIDAICRRLRKDLPIKAGEGKMPDKAKNLPFGGLQVVLCGDFFQLPPIMRSYNWSSGNISEANDLRGDYSSDGLDSYFIYRSKAWKDGNFTVCYLSENFRHKDDVSISVLNDIRSGEISARSYEHLMARQSVDSSKLAVAPTRLFTHNIDVDQVNFTELDKITDTEHTYEMSARGKKHALESLKKSCLAPEILRLKKGARVMCVKNNFEAGYVNGTLGVVVSCGYGLDPVIHTAPTPDFPQGRRLTIEQATWTIDDDGFLLAEVKQYPLRLAWAITVHKSQGMSLDAVEVDLSKSFEPGMGYVALSRVRSFEGLKILGINEMALRVHPEVLEYDRHLRDLSSKAEAVLADADNSSLKKMHDGFLAKVAPLHGIIQGQTKKIGSASSLKKYKNHAKTKTLRGKYREANY
ncbi:MAG: PIF1 family DEAD/DEAH box helicase [Candidatus Taylorbacteria bacterium]